MLHIANHATLRTVVPMQERQPPPQPGHRTQTVLWRRASSHAAAEASHLEAVGQPIDTTIGEPAESTAWITPARTNGIAGAVAFVPDGLESPITRNGVRLSSGVHVLRHGDRLQLGEATVWFAVDGTPTERPYEPASDGADRFCARTKVRLRDGEPVTACPGTPTQSCGELYRSAAWNGELACHGCGFDARSPGFTPPSENTTRRRPLGILPHESTEDRDG